MATAPKPSEAHFPSINEREGAALPGQTEILDLVHVLIRDTSDRIVFWNAGAEDCTAGQERKL